MYSNDPGCVKYCIIVLNARIAQLWRRTSEAMTDFLLTWLNQTVGLSRLSDADSFTFDYSNGYLFGELLSKYGLVSNLNEFSKSNDENAKIDNYVLLQPTLQTLGIRLSANEVCNIMHSQEGAATRLLYQLYIVLNKAGGRKPAKSPISSPRSSRSLNARKDNASSVASTIEMTELVKRIKQRDNLDDMQFFRERLVAENKKFRAKPVSATTRKRTTDFVKLRTDLLAKLHVGIGVMPPRPANVADIRKAQRRKENEDRVAIQALEELTKIDSKIAKLVKGDGESELKANAASRPSSTKRSGEPSSKQTPFTSMSVGRSMFDPRTLDWTIPVGFDYFNMLAPDQKAFNEYVDRLKKRYNELALADEEQAKRLRRIKLDESRATEAQQEIIEEERTVKRLWKQSQVQRSQTEKQLAARAEKIRIFNERRQKALSFFERRAEEFERALDNEKLAIQNDKVARKEELEEKDQLHRSTLQQRAQSKRERATQLCTDVVNRLVEFSLNVAEHREQHNYSFVPARLYRAWTQEFCSGRSPVDQAIAGHSKTLLLSDTENGETQTEIVLGTVVDNELNTEFNQYLKMEGLWMGTPEGEETEYPTLRPNVVLDRVVSIFHEIVYPPTPVEPVDKHRPCPLKICLAGKPFVGLSTCVQKLAETYKLVVLDPPSLANAALAAFARKELESRLSLSPLSPEQQAAAEESESPVDPDSQLLQPATGEQAKLSTRAILGERIFKLQQKGKPVDDTINAELIADCLRRLPADRNYGAIIDGFPTTQKQALLLEGMLWGCELEVKDSKVHGISVEYVKSKRKPKSAANDLPEQPRSAFDLFVVLDAPDSTALQRYRSGVAQVESPPLSESVVQQNISAFGDAWPKLERLYTKLGNLHSIDASASADEVYEKVDELIAATVRAKQASEMSRESTLGQAEGAIESSDATQPSNYLDKQVSVCEGTAQHQADRLEIPLQIATAIYNEWTDGSEKYELKVRQLIADLLQCKEALWASMQKCKSDTIDRLNQISDYASLIREWVAQYNKISRKQLADKDVQLELHDSVDELVEALWSISDSRKDYNVNMLEAAFTTDWMETYMKSVVHAHAQLALVELQRFERAIRILVTYYYFRARAKMAPPPLPTVQEVPQATPATATAAEPVNASQLTPVIEQSVVGEQTEATPDVPESEESGTDVSYPIDMENLLVPANENNILDVFYQWMLSPEDELSQVQSAGELADTIRNAYYNDLLYPLISQSGEERAAKCSKMMQQQHEILCERVLQLVSHARRLILRAEKNCTALKSSIEEIITKKYHSELAACTEVLQTIKMAVNSHTKVNMTVLNNLLDKATESKIPDDLDEIWQSASDSRRPLTPEVQLLPQNKLTEVTAMAREMRQRAPQGKMGFHQFSQMLIDMAAADQLPGALRDVTVHSGNSLAYHLSPEGSNTVDWRDFAFLLCEPYPMPSLSDLLKALVQLADKDPKRTGLVHREAFRTCNFWFKDVASRKSSAVATKEIVCSSVDGSECTRHRSARIHTARLRNLDETLFEIFATKKAANSFDEINYLDLLLHFCATPDGFDGFTRALILASIYYSSATFAILKSTAESVIKQISAMETLKIPIQALEKVLNRREMIASMEMLRNCFAELDAFASVPYNRLMSHPTIFELVKCASQVQYVQNDLNAILQSSGIDRKHSKSSSVATSVIIPVKASLLG